MLPRPSLSRAVKQQGHVQVLHGDVEELPGALDASLPERKSPQWPRARVQAWQLTGLALAFS